ncbi:hypothetical protein [Dyadobacter pollutisoli]|uniref:Uncharacterized protein n=1 Tax=Dyadobacter pollutisoli TaxID=2910158 RepID=A0A9E8SIL5_9BACT|nr:hypothetical protein [Dyadobacter pollutisoli]WAC09269.1 hypothetical protein ON006_16065 [Dyadobacter pollutisoli]
MRLSKAEEQIMEQVWKHENTELDKYISRAGWVGERPNKFRK